MLQNRVVAISLAGLTLGSLLVVASGPPDRRRASQEARLAAAVSRFETEMDARIGVAVRQPATGWQWSYRGEERFPMASTFKPLLCAAVLSAVERGDERLDQPITYRTEDLVAWSPITEGVRRTTLGEACAAALSHSDNTAANLAMGVLGGPQAVTAFLRGIGDSVTRLDRWETELNEGTPGDPRDTSTPLAMLSSLERVALGDALSHESSARLLAWMEENTVSDSLIRSVLPSGWTIADRSGAGQNGTRNITAVLHDPEGGAAVVAIFVTQAQAKAKERDSAVAEIARQVLAALEPAA